MNSLVASKMFKIAAHLSELNEKGSVKAYKKNEHGYAKVVEIKQGCSIWVHHLLDNQLILDLQISPTAQKRYREACDLTVQNFNNFFDTIPTKEPWYHADKPRDPWGYCPDLFLHGFGIPGPWSYQQEEQKALSGLGQGGSGG